MHISQVPYRELFNSLCEYQGINLYSEILQPWCENAVSIKTWLSNFAARKGSPIPEASIEELWQLYALSRVNELLLRRFQRDRADKPDWWKPAIAMSEYIDFMRSLGFEPVTPMQFSPFYYEIVEVIPDEQQHAEITVVSLFWPGFMLGNMMFSRAGTCVAGGVANINQSIAETSTLYWAYTRKNRPYQNLSHGWGSNSQWRTSFRRDYEIDNIIYYNVDGENDLSLGHFEKEDSDDLELEERIELLKHRCFIKVNKPHDDLDPYNDFYYETA